MQSKNIIFITLFAAAMAAPAPAPVDTDVDVAVDAPVSFEHELTAAELAERDIVTDITNFAMNLIGKVLPNGGMIGTCNVTGCAADLGDTLATCVMAFLPPSADSVGKCVQEGVQDVQTVPQTCGGCAKEIAGIFTGKNSSTTTATGNSTNQSLAVNLTRREPERRSTPVLLPVD